MREGGGERSGSEENQIHSNETEQFSEEPGLAGAW